QSSTVTVSLVSPPNAGSNALLTVCESGAPVDLFASLQGTPDAGGVWSPALASGSGIFNPSVDPQGVYTYTVSGTSPCTSQSSTVTVSLVSPPNAGSNGLLTVCESGAPVDLFASLQGTPDAGGVWSPALASGSGIFNPSVDPQGVYTYTVSGTSPCLEQTATVTVTVVAEPDAGNFTGVQTYCRSVMSLDLFLLLDGTQQTGGIWTNSNGDTVQNPVSFDTLISGENTFTYTVQNECGNANESVRFILTDGPQLVLEDISIVTPFCQGNSTIVSLFNLPDGNYTLTYVISGANNSSEQTLSFISNDGEAQFTIDASLIANSGVSQLTILTLISDSNGCITSFSDYNISFTVLPLPQIDATSIQIPQVCLGENVLVALSNALGLVDGVYQITYSIPGANPVTGSASNVVIENGQASFTIPGSVFTAAGTYNLLIVSINNTTSGCVNLNVGVTKEFVILPLSVISEVQPVVSSVCLNAEGSVTLSGVTNLSNGTYTVNYQISGVVTANVQTEIGITNGNGTLIIPAGLLNAIGSITLSIEPLNSQTPGACGISGHTFLPVSIILENVPTPEINTTSVEFCESDSATISNLNDLITSSQTIVWYDSAQNGNVLSNSHPLENGVTYYASIRNSLGCESIIRLEVPVTISDCQLPDIVIPDGFSPNGDGINDAFEIKNIRTLYPNFTIEIYNRYGTILYKGNKDKPDWNGTSSNGIQVGGNQLPVGVYFFILNFNDGARKPLQGRLYLSR
uniref:gliding motility-associated C-terminal domain-containing protein n=1 Tax=Flavobacterium sp. TaxID=239 RepID=UPI002FD99FB1